MRTFIAIIAVLAAACSGNVTSETVGTLTVTEAEGEVSGVYELDGEVLTFRSVVLDGIVEAQVELHGMILDAVVDPEGGVSSIDGFAEAGGETQLVDEDRLMLAAFYQSLNEYWPGNGLSTEATLLRRLASIWSQHPSSLELTRTVMGEEGRGYTMLCSYAHCGTWSGACAYWNWYSYADHDGWGHDNNDSDAQQVAQIGDHHGCGGDVYFWNNAWYCGEPDHWRRPYEMGNCNGRCGGGCGGDTQYTKDATDHDGCVRNGHSTFSSWCSDEFSYAADDELYAPNCY